eukprot:CAMPEP_0185285528 /NCGR_PEP_ID=MMETSP1363-20130426/1782_1 /TAXON_ID=38817 /ORGANISM="Gephyrocapsa oceanica, Strain RCC1303" /LENGTH=168 /DNA_ID=CAMNT_0027881315 /DNA_START=78 /DNA_END=580 /DNA_ORIENTATION=+
MGAACTRTSRHARPTAAPWHDSGNWMMDPSAPARETQPHHDSVRERQSWTASRSRHAPGCAGRETRARVGEARSHLSPASVDGTASPLACRRPSSTTAFAKCSRCRHGRRVSPTAPPAGRAAERASRSQTRPSARRRRRPPPRAAAASPPAPGRWSGRAPGRAALAAP